MFEEDSRCAAFESPQRAGVGHARRDHQDAAGESSAGLARGAGTGAFGLFEKCQALVVAEVVIEQHDVDRFAREDGEAFGGRGGGGDDPEVRLSFEQPAQALPEQAVIVDQENPHLRHGFLSA